jgi:hypothetical protein
MRRAAMLMLLFGVALGSADLGVPKAVPLTCTCLQQQQDCAAECRADLCQTAIFICDQSNPCDSTCKCEKCLP